MKPTNVLVNRKGQVKLCDFGVSGQLEKSLAKTNIGCQSYMAVSVCLLTSSSRIPAKILPSLPQPERIKGESQNNLGTYTVSSDVWSLGLSMIELAIGKYPYPPETYQNVFAQLTAIVNGDPPELPDTYSEDARDWVSKCLVKAPDCRATYTELLVSNPHCPFANLPLNHSNQAHPFLVADLQRSVDMVSWVEEALAHREEQLRNHVHPPLVSHLPTEPTSV